MRVVIKTCTIWLLRVTYQKTTQNTCFIAVLCSFESQIDQKHWETAVLGWFEKVLSEGLEPRNAYGDKNMYYLIVKSYISKNNKKIFYCCVMVFWKPDRQKTLEKQLFLLWSENLLYDGLESRSTYGDKNMYYLMVKGCHAQIMYYLIVQLFIVLFVY